MSNKEYRRALERAKKEMIDLLKQRQKIDRRISRLKTSIYDLEDLCGEPNKKNGERATPAKSGPKLGLTAAVRKTLQDAAPLGLTPIEVRRRMERQGFDFSKYRNPLSAIHTVLKRVAENDGRAEVEIRPGNKKAYQWITELDVALGLLEDENQPAGGKGTK